ncbi:unnamed protein product [Cunninghamella echinulata]
MTIIMLEYSGCFYKIRSTTIIKKHICQKKKNNEQIRIIPVSDQNSCIAASSNIGEPIVVSLDSYTWEVNSISLEKTTIRSLNTQVYVSVDDGGKVITVDKPKNYTDFFFNSGDGDQYTIHVKYNSLAWTIDDADSAAKFIKISPIDDLTKQKFIIKYLN